MYKSMIPVFFVPTLLRANIKRSVYDDPLVNELNSDDTRTTSNSRENVTSKTSIWKRDLGRSGKGKKRPFIEKNAYNYRKK